MALVSFDTAHRGPIHDAQLDYYGKVLATASSDGTIRLWNVSSDPPQFLSELRGHDGPVWQVAWSHPKYEGLLASASHDRKIIIWREGPSGVWTPVYISEDHTASVSAVQYAPWEQGLHIAAGSLDGTISVLSYNVEAGLWNRKAFMAHPNGVLCVGWCPATSSSSVRHVPVPAQGPVPKFQHSPGGLRRLVSGGCDHQVRIWVYVDSTNEWVMSHHLKESPHQGWVRHVAWRPFVGLSGGQLITSCSEDHKIILWQETDNLSWKNRQVLDLGEPVWKVSWSVTGTVLSAVSGSKCVSLFKESLQGRWEPFSLVEEQNTAALPSDSYNDGDEREVVNDNATAQIAFQQQSSTQEPHPQSRLGNVADTTYPPQKTGLLANEGSRASAQQSAPFANFAPPSFSQPAPCPEQQQQQWLHNGNTAGTGRPVQQAQPWPVLGKFQQGMNPYQTPQHPPMGGY